MDKGENVRKLAQSARTNKYGDGNRTTGSGRSGGVNRSVGKDLSGETGRSTGKDLSGETGRSTGKDLSGETGRSTGKDLSGETDRSTGKNERGKAGRSTGTGKGGTAAKRISTKRTGSLSEAQSRREKQKKWREHLKETLPPEKYEEILKRERQHQMLVWIGSGAGVLAAVLLLVLGVRKVTSLVGHKEASGGQVVIESETEAAVYPEKDITIGSTGCMLLHSPFINSYPDAEGNYDFSSIYKYITPYYSEPDYMTCEFEGTLGGKELGYSGYPNFKSPDAIIENIRDSGVDLQMIATNHSYDGLSSAFHRTMDVYEEKGIPYTGMRKNGSAKRYYVADINGVSVGFMNYVYETTGSGVNLNGIPLQQEDWDLINSFDYDNLEPFYQEVQQNIEGMRADGARFIVANMHWGIEYQLKESDDQRKIAQKLCDLGVDALIGGHPHCIQPIDVFENADKSHAMFCIFSEGNALSNQRTYLLANRMPEGHTEDGVMVTLSLHQDTAGTVSITGIDLLPTWVYRFQEDGSKYYILPLDDPDSLAEKTGIADLGNDPQRSYERTMEELGDGLAKAKQYFES